MAIRLQLENGKIKSYRTSFGMGTMDPPSNGPHKTSCGMKWNDDPGIVNECNHLDCGISASKDGFKQYALLSTLIIIFGIIVSLVGMHAEPRYSFGLFEIALGGMFGLPAIHYHLQNKELEEFKDRGKINGHNAKKL
jgi:hypothetical protein